MTSHGALLEGEFLVGEAPRRPLALWWRGHQPSDEINAFLAASRATNWQQFHTAFASYAVSGQTLMYADAQGRIGALTAFRFSPGASRALTAGVGDPALAQHDPEPGWSAPDLPQVIDPPSGVLWSANNPLARTEPSLAPLAPLDERTRRLAELTAGPLRNRDDLARLQMDTKAPSALALSRALAEHPAAAKHPVLRRALAVWDGYFARESTEAAAAMLAIREVAQRHWVQRYGPAVAGVFQNSASMRALLLEDLVAGRCEEILAEALAVAAEAYAEYPRYGDVHRLRVAHVLADLPVVGPRLVMRDVPADGAAGTVNKSAARTVDGVEYAVYGANARVICDLSDVDGLWLVLCGGQDGWIGSTAFADQIDDWQANRLRPLPLSQAGVAKAFPYVVELRSGKDSMASESRAIGAALPLAR